VPCCGSLRGVGCPQATPLAYAKQTFAGYERDEAGLVQARIDATLALLS
jgi:hypothetical protein